MPARSRDKFGDLLNRFERPLLGDDALVPSKRPTSRLKNGGFMRLLGLTLRLC
jgi:hypothetical protein